jgi:hypothetical protein
VELKDLFLWFGNVAGRASEPWRRALREASDADTRRLVQARCAELDAAQHQVRYYATLYGTGEAKMNGRPLRLVSVEPEIPETRGRKIR